MATVVTPVKALNNYFNTGDGKVSTREFAAEVKALSDTEKAELAQAVCDLMGWELKK